tara:strand:- start:86 stop:832 length:747 start_codon:yes stop_codon:yes gene_type:complete
MKVVVGGCSVSNSWGHEPSPDGVYGQILANQIGADYIHHSVDGGSNYRIWRKITQMVMNNDITDKFNIPYPEEVITKDDIVIIQYTQPTREEYFSIKDSNESNIQYEAEECEVDDDGNIIRFKLDSQNIPNLNKHEKKFFDLKEKYFTSINFDKERFEYNHYLFHNLMMSKGIKVVYLMSSKRPLSNYCFKYRNLFNKNGELHLNLFEDNNEYFRHMDGSIDHYHFSKKGHEYVANELKKLTEQQGWL